MKFREFRQHAPELFQHVYVDKTAVIIGEVNLADNVSIWPMAVLRGDINYIRVGKNSNVQDGSVLHVTHHCEYSPGGYPVIVGEDVTIGHHVILHGCTIGNNCLIGMGSTILDGATIHDNVIIGANSLVSSQKKLAGGFLYFGNPVKQIRPLTDKEIESIRYSAAHYVELKDEYLNAF